MRTTKISIAIILVVLLAMSFSAGRVKAASWPDRDLVYGMTGEDVAVLQSALEAKGYNTGGVDGYFGAVTYAAVCKYQSDHGLYVDGVVGKITVSSLLGAQTSGQASNAGQRTGPAATQTASTPTSLSLGMTGTYVYQLQAWLQGKGYNVGSLDGYFGTYTQAAVMKYQKDHDLYVDGVVGPYTLAAMYGNQPSTSTGSQSSTTANSQPTVPVQNAEIYEHIFNQTLTKGMSGADVVALQSMLSRMGYSVGDIDGVFGAYTEAAVKAFQRDHSGLYVDGVVGSQTSHALDSVLSGLSDQNSFKILDTVLATGSSYTVQPQFTDGKSHAVSLSSSSSAISISGMTITAVKEGSAEVRAECEGESITFFIEVRNQDYIDANYGNIENALSYTKGFAQRMEELNSYSGDYDTMVLLAGDSYLDDRLHLTDLDSRFAGGNVYSTAVSGSTTQQWLSSMSSIYQYEPESLVMNLGVNDIRFGESTVSVINNLKTLFGSIAQNMPNTTIYWWNIVPHIGAANEYYKIAAVNTAIQDYSRQNSNLVVVDAYGAMANSNGTANAALYKDNLHPNSSGFDRLFQKTYQAGLQVTQSGK